MHLRSRLGAMLLFVLSTAAPRELPATVGNPGKLIWEDIESLHQLGHEIASHTHDHVALIDNRALSLQFLGSESCTLFVDRDTLKTTIEGQGSDLFMVLTDSTYAYLIDLVAELNANPEYSATLLYASDRQYATQSRFLVATTGIPIGAGQGAPPGTLTTRHGVHDDLEMAWQIGEAQRELETRLQSIDPDYLCRTLAYPHHAHRQWVMSTLNEMGYKGCRSGTIGTRPFYSEGSYSLGYTTSYEVPLYWLNLNNSWDEAFTRQKFRDRMPIWKANHEWAILMAHHEGEADSQHVEWMIDEIASDPDIWIASFGEVAGYLETFFTDVGYPVDETGTVATAWVHRLNPADTIYVVVSAYNAAFEESGWSNEIAIYPPVTGVDIGETFHSVVPARVTPNPFRTETTLDFRIPYGGRTVVAFFDVRGAMISEFDLGWTAPGTHYLTWNGRSFEGRPVPAGLYLYEIRLDGYSESGKVVRLR